MYINVYDLISNNFILIIGYYYESAYRQIVNIAIKLNGDYKNKLLIYTLNMAESFYL